jgi:hypothetical protein
MSGSEDDSSHRERSEHVVLDFADSDEGFSGFGPEDIPIEREEVIVTSDVMQTNKKKYKSSMKKVKSKPKQTKKKNSKKPTKPAFNIDSLSQADLETLGALGF